MTDNSLAIKTTSERQSVGEHAGIALTGRKKAVDFRPYYALGAAAVAWELWRDKMEGRRKARKRKERLVRSLALQGRRDAVTLEA